MPAQQKPQLCLESLIALLPELFVTKKQLEQLNIYHINQIWAIYMIGHGDYVAEPKKIIEQRREQQARFQTELTQAQLELVKLHKEKSSEPKAIQEQ
jgi:hypothetical protein